MSRFTCRVARYLLGAALVASVFTVASGRLSAQQVTATRVVTVPSGLAFTIDGQLYNAPFSGMWPAGSKHTLAVQPVQNLSGGLYTFQHWEVNGGVIPQSLVTITADPSITEFRAVFQTQYKVSFRFNDCSPKQPCAYPGYITVDGTPVYRDVDAYYSEGAVVNLQAFPNPGWVFDGWVPGPNQFIQGFQNTLTVNAPATVSAQFHAARTITFTTSPPNLQVLADRTQVTTPASLDWGLGSVHAVGVMSPQQDLLGKWWAFSSWSDGGAQYHAITVTTDSSIAALTAVFVPTEHVVVASSPWGLKLKIDGRDDWVGNAFTWGIGEKHRIEAPDQQTDSQGKVWGFSKWSIGGPLAQDIVIPATDDGNYTVTALYGPVGSLTVTSPLSGVAVKVDGADCQTPCQVYRAVGTAVRVSAPASIPLNDQSTSRADFAQWSGDAGSSAASADWTGTLDAKPLAIAANYRTLNRLTPASDPSGAADWRMAPASADGFYDSQATVNVSATARPGYRFRAWTGDLTGASSTGSVSMTSPRYVRALLDSVPYVSPSGVANAAGGAPDAGVAPGSIVSIFGANLASATATAAPNPLPQALAGVTVQVADRWLPLMFVSPAQINVQLPADLPLGPQTVVINVPGQPEASADFTVVREAPGLFPQVVDGRLYAIAFHEDGSLITSASPAKRSELITLYGTGFGPTDHARPLGFTVPKDPAYALTDTAVILAGDATLKPEQAVALAGSIGIDVLRFRLSGAVPAATDVPLHVKIQDQDSNLVLLPVE